MKNKTIISVLAALLVPLLGAVAWQRAAPLFEDLNWD